MKRSSVFEVSLFLEGEQPNFTQVMTVIGVDYKQSAAMAAPLWLEVFDGVSEEQLLDDRVFAAVTEPGKEHVEVFRLSGKRELKVEAWYT